MNTNVTNNDQPKKPAFIAKTRQGYGKNVSYERVGVGFLNDDGSVFVSLAGTQVISDFMLYKIEPTEAATEEN